jgi:hypothetical protein
LIGRGGSCSPGVAVAPVADDLAATTSFFERASGAREKEGIWHLTSHQRWQVIVETEGTRNGSTGEVRPLPSPTDAPGYAISDHLQVPGLHRREDPTDSVSFLYHRVTTSVLDLLIQGRQAKRPGKFGT